MVLVVWIKVLKPGFQGARVTPTLTGYKLYKPKGYSVTIKTLYNHSKTFYNHNTWSNS